MNHQFNMRDILYRRKEIQVEKNLAETGHFLRSRLCLPCLGIVYSQLLKSPGPSSSQGWIFTGVLFFLTKKGSSCSYNQATYSESRSFGHYIWLLRNFGLVGFIFFFLFWILSFLILQQGMEEIFGLVFWLDLVGYSSSESLIWRDISYSSGSSVSSDAHIWLDQSLDIHVLVFPSY